eukprot:COSAG02_NODE_4531_length_5252_cov_2.871919_3_plen_606_part_00
MEPDVRDGRGKAFGTRSAMGKSASKGKGKGKGKRGDPRRVARNGEPRPELEPAPVTQLRATPGSSPSTGRRQSGSRTAGSKLQQQIVNAIAGHEQLESRIEAMGRQLFTDTKKRCAAKEKLDQEVEALEELRRELDQLGCVICPVCNERFPKREIQPHVDSCLSRMLEHIEETVERAPGVQRALRPRPVQKESAGVDHYEDNRDDDDGDSLTSFDLEGSTGPDGTAVWNNPLTSSTRNRVSSWPVASSPLRGESSVRQQREERRRQRQSPSRPHRRSPQRSWAGDLVDPRSNSPLESSAATLAHWPSDPVAVDRRRRLLGLHSIDDAQACVPPSSQTIDDDDNRSWADRHPGLAKLVASADAPSARRPSPPRMYDALPGVATSPTSAAPDEPAGLSSRIAPVPEPEPGPEPASWGTAENLIHRSGITAVDIRTGGRDTVAAITPPAKFNAQFWQEQSDDPREWSTQSCTPAAPGQALAPPPAVVSSEGAGQADLIGGNGLPSTEELPMLPPPPPPSLELTVSANNSSPISHSSHRSVAAELRDLQSLHAEGVLTTAEFEAQKKAVLKRGLGPSENSGVGDSSVRSGRSGKPYAWQAQLDSLGWGA